MKWICTAESGEWFDFLIFSPPFASCTISSQPMHVLFLTWQYSFSHQRINHLSQALIHFCEQSNPCFFFILGSDIRTPCTSWGSSCPQGYEDVMITAKFIHCQFEDF